MCELHENYEAHKEDNKGSVEQVKTFSDVRSFQKIPEWIFKSSIYTTPG